MRLDHLLSREKAKMETSELHTEVDCGRKSVVKEASKKQNERQRTFRNRWEAETRFESVSSSGFAKKSHFDNCTVKKDSEKTSLGKQFYFSIGLRIDEKIKLQRAQGGCPGTIRRRRTWQAAKSYGEPQAGTDP